MNESETELLKALRESAEEDLRFLSNRGREERERWVVSEFLKCQRLDFQEEELHSLYQHSKIDVEFRDARFQVKEILNPETKRYRDAKARYERLMAATSLQDINWPMFGYDVPAIARIYDLVASEAFALSISKKYVTEKENIDLIFYITRTHAALIQKEEIDQKYLSSLGWRSISCLAGKQATALFVSRNAPTFLHSSQNGG